MATKTPMTDQSVPDGERPADSKQRKVSLKRLWLDPNNYRLIHEPEYVPVQPDKVKDKSVAQRTFKLLAGERSQNIQDLVDSFRNNGYLPVDQIQVRPLGDGDYLVVEGNRRIAALKFLSDVHDKVSVDLGQLDPST